MNNKWESLLSSKQLSRLAKSYTELHKHRIELLEKHIEDTLGRLEGASSMELELEALLEALLSIIKKRNPGVT